MPCGNNTRSDRESYPTHTSLTPSSTSCTALKQIVKPGLLDCIGRRWSFQAWRTCFRMMLSLSSVPPPPPRSSGVPARGHTERSQRASGVAAAPRPRAAGARAARACAPAARLRAARAGACTHSNAPCPGSRGGGGGVVVVVVVVGDNSAKFPRPRLPRIWGSLWR